MFNDNAREIGKHPWSYSKLSVGIKCPFQFQRRYVERVKPTNEVSSARATIGTTIHSIMEHGLLCFHEAGAPFSRDAVKDAIKHAYEKTLDGAKLTSEEFEEIMFLEEAAETMLWRLAKFKSENNCAIYVEEPLGITAGMMPAPYASEHTFFRGIIDLVMVTPGGVAAIIDHKTGYPSLRGYEKQLKAYEVLVSVALAPKIYQEHGIKLKAVRSALNFIPEQSIQWSNMVPQDKVLGVKSQEFIDLVNSTSDQIQEGKVNRGNHCNYCSYRSYCGSKVGTRKKKGKSNAHPAV